MLTAGDRARIQSNARAAIERPTLRKDPWWAYPGAVGIFLGVTILYSTWAGIWKTGYFAEPYISPIFSPCLAVNCEHATFRLIGEWWFLSPALLVMWLPILFRLTCYYYRKAYYRAFAFLPNFGPPACAVKEPWPKYSGETKGVFLFQNVHRYFFYLMIGNLVFLYWDTILAFRFDDGWHVNVGSLIFVVMIATMTLYMLSCHSCRHIFAGRLDTFSRAPLRYRFWKFVSKLNTRHGPYALASLLWIPITDLYVRLVAADIITDVRLI